MISHILQTSDHLLPVDTGSCTLPKMCNEQENKHKTKTIYDTGIKRHNSVYSGRLEVSCHEKPFFLPFWILDEKSENSSGRIFTYITNILLYILNTVALHIRHKIMNLSVNKNIAII